MLIRQPLGHSVYLCLWSELTRQPTRFKLLLLARPTDRKILSVFNTNHPTPRSAWNPVHVVCFAVFQGNLIIASNRVFRYLKSDIHRRTSTISIAASARYIYWKTLTNFILFRTGLLVKFYNAFDNYYMRPVIDFYIWYLNCKKIILLWILAKCNLFLVKLK